MSTPFVHLHLHSHYSILDGMGKIVIIILVFCFLFSGCTREDDIDLLVVSQNSNLSPKRSIIPIKLSRFSFKPKPETKSSLTSDTSQIFCLDSLIDQTNPRQIFFEKSGWNYCQIPFIYNETGVFAAVGAKSENIKDSLVKIKSFFLQVNNINNNKASEYIVTLLPTKHYSLVNPDYDYIDKPSFSGVILYSDKIGNLLRTEYLKDGIINHCYLKEASGFNTKAIKTKSQIYTCTSCGADTYEADQICIVCKALDLNSIVILGDGIDWNNYISMLLLNLAGELDYIAPPGGGGGSPDLGSGGGGIENTDTMVPIICRATGCFNALLTISFLTRGSVFYYSAPLRSLENVCWFNEWAYDNISSHQISVNKNNIIIHSVQETQTLNAVYSTNNACDTIAGLMQDGTLKAVIDTLFYTISLQNNFFGNQTNEWYSVLYNDSRGYKTGMGTKDNTKVPLLSSPQTGVFANQLIHHSHYHTSGNPRPSIKDLAALCMFFLYDCANVKASTFSILTDDNVIVIRMNNLQTFLLFINKYLIDNNFNEWHQKQTDILIDRFSKEYKDLYRNCSQPYESIDVVKNLLESIGLELFWGTKNTDPTTGAINIQWNNTDFLDITPIPLGCISY